MIRNEIDLRRHSTMAKQQLVNLDALIRREDFEIIADDGSASPARSGRDFSLKDLSEGENVFDVLRKPDFQRETSNWTPEAIVELITNQLDEELIPAIILWKSPNNQIFVIDGAHRLSAIMAWVNDDYGNGTISRHFFGLKITKAQISADEEVRKQIKSIGSYKLLQGYIKNNAGAEPLAIKRANAIASVFVKTQWVEGGADKAEGSFVRINRGGAIIGDTEREIITARKKPSAIAARALLRAGSGHQYWWKFRESGKKEVIALAQQIYSLLGYDQDLPEHIKAYDILPMAGKSYSEETLSTLYDLILIANELSRESAKDIKGHSRELSEAEWISAEKDTVRYLRKVKAILQLILSKKEESLGLHPAVYCYSVTGNFQQVGFFSEVKWVQYLGTMHDGFHEFTKYRAKFEDFLVDHKYFLNQLVRGLGSKTRGLPRLIKLYTVIYSGIKDGKTTEKIKEDIFDDEDFSHLSEKPPISKKKGKGGFSGPAKSAVKIGSALERAQRCPECGARVYPLTDQIDHIIRAEDDGSNFSNNGAMMHPFCNTGVKERRVAEAKKGQQP